MRSRAVGGRGAYAGIGSRDTPDAMLALIETIAASLARAGWVLRTGLSPGADQAFYRATVAAGGTVELYLPWPGFGARARVERERENVREQSQPSPAAYELATHFYRAWHGAEWAELAAREQALLARDAHQVLGAELDSSAICVVCWTPDGGVDGSDPRSQGTGQALRVARHHSVPVFNLANPEHVREVREFAARR